MSVLINLPSVLFSEVATQWLFTNELTKLDTACCNKTLRKQFLIELKLLLPIKHLTILRRYRFNPANLYQWIFDRRIKLQQYDFHSSHFVNGSLRYGVDFTWIKMISGYFSDNGNCWRQILNSCDNLVKLSVNDITFTYVDEQVLKRLSSIVVFLTSHDAYKAALNKIANYCQQLEEINLRSDEVNILQEFKEIIKQNKLLHTFGGCSDLDLLTFLIYDCPTIINITFSLCYLSSFCEASFLCDILKRNVSKYNVKIDEFADTTQQFHYIINDEKKSLVLELFDYTDMNILEILSSSADFTSLRIECLLTNDIVRDIYTNFCHSLTSLFLNTVDDVSVEVIRHIVSDCKYLTDLSLHGISDANIIVIFENEPNKLKKLDFITNEIIEFKLSAALNIMKNAVVLQSLYVSVINSFDISFEDVESELKQLKRLKRADVDFSSNGSIQKSVSFIFGRKVSR